MIADRIRSLAASSGAALAVALPDSEVVSFEFRPDGELQIYRADGERLISASLHANVHPDDRDDYRATFLDLLRHLALLTPGGPIRSGIRYHRRNVQVAEGERAPIFTEAGR